MGKSLRQKISERTSSGLTRAQRARANKGVQALIKSRKDQGLTPLNQVQLSKKRAEFERKAKRA